MSMLTCCSSNWMDKTWGMYWTVPEDRGFQSSDQLFGWALGLQAWVSWRWSLKKFQSRLTFATASFCDLWNGLTCPGGWIFWTKKIYKRAPLIQKSLERHPCLVNKINAGVACHLYVDTKGGEELWVHCMQPFARVLSFSAFRPKTWLAVVSSVRIHSTVCQCVWSRRLCVESIICEFQVCD